LFFHDLRYIRIRKGTYAFLWSTAKSIEYSEALLICATLLVFFDTTAE